MAYTRPHEQRLGSGSAAPGYVLKFTGTGVAEWGAATAVPDGVDPGDLLVWDGTAWDVLPVGLDDRVLTADAAEVLGVRWGTGGAAGTVPDGTAIGDILVWDGADWVPLARATNRSLLSVDTDAPLEVDWIPIGWPVDNEIPNGVINGVNDTFTLGDAPKADTLHLYKNGLRQSEGAGEDFTITGDTITFAAGNIPQTGDKLRADYRF